MKKNYTGWYKKRMVFIRILKEKQDKTPQTALPFCGVCCILGVVICMENSLPKRRHPRLKFYDYSTAGGYFITICTQNRRCLLSRIVGRGLAPAEIQYTQCGQIVRRQLRMLEQRYPSLKIDQYVIMPNHIHAIFILSETAEDTQRPALSDIVCAFKSLTTRACKKVQTMDTLFQTSFYEHVIRDREDYDKIAEYIANNPKQWELDSLYTEE